MKPLIREVKETLRTIPGLVTAVFVLSVVVMNLFANKSIFNTQYTAVTSGIMFSWISFLCMDCVCKRFGARAATILNTSAMLINLFCAILFAFIVKIPGVWSAVYSSPIESAEAVNVALDMTFGSTWYVVIGSALAMYLGGLTNSVVNRFVGKRADTGTYKGFAIRSFLSTAAGQWVDNIVFAVCVSYIFFGWTLTQVFMCSLIGMLLELLIEIVFSPIGYKISKTWENENVGKDYILKYNNEVSQ